MGRVAFEEALKQQVEREKEVTRHNDRVSAARRRLPMVEVENYTFMGRNGPTTMLDLFGDHYLLLVQNVMFDPRLGCRLPELHLGGRQPAREYGADSRGGHCLRHDLGGSD